VTRIRPLSEEDIPALVELRPRAFAPGPSLVGNDLARHFREVFLDGPWADPENPSLVLETGGRVRAFMGVLSRPLSFEGRPCRAALSAQLLVDPERPAGLAAIKLLQEVKNRACDLVITDGATGRVKRLWRQLGGEVAWLQAFRWIRLLRPAAYGLWWPKSRRHRLAPVTTVLSPLAVPADALVARVRPNRYHEPVQGLSEEPFAVDAWLEALPRVTGAMSLTPAYDRPSAEWILGQLARKRRHGPLEATLLRAEDGSVVGWHLYHRRRDAPSMVVEVRAVPDKEEVVLRHLFRHAWLRGAIALTGWADSRMAAPLGELHAYFQLGEGGPWTLCYSRRPEILAAIHGGAAALTRLDLEHWMRFDDS
jgi:hypothetical protein